MIKVKCIDSRKCVHDLQIVKLVTGKPVCKVVLDCD